MILTLQKRHRWIWTILAVLLPIGFLSAYFAIQEVPTNSAGEPQVIRGEITAELYDDAFHIIERSDEREDTAFFHLIVDVLKPISQSASVIYISATDKVEDGRLIGCVNQRGRYVFELLDPMQTNDKILLYNPIQKTVFHILSRH
jgi:hypothetical protein